MTNTSPVIIKPHRGWIPLKLHDLWEHRELLYFLVWRDVKVRYKQTALGVMWAVIQPFLAMVVFSVFFGRLAKISFNELPYPVAAYTGILPWTLFARALTESSNSLVANQHLITKVYFPRLVIPLSSVISGLVDFAIAFVILVAMMLFYGIVPKTTVLIFPLFLLMAMVTALGVGLWLSALNVRYRDVRYTVSFLTQIWFFITPVVYPSSLLSEKSQIFYGLNPMVGVVEGFRWALLGQKSPYSPMLITSIMVALLLLVTGSFYFRRMEKTFADVV